jgi:hypothetical protein
MLLIWPVPHKARQSTRREALKNSGDGKTKPLTNWKIQLAFGSAILTLRVVGAIPYRAGALPNESKRRMGHTHETMCARMNARRPGSADCHRSRGDE